MEGQMKTHSCIKLWTCVCVCVCVCVSSPTRIFSISPLLAVCCFSSRSLSWEQICDTNTQRGQGSVTLWLKPIHCTCFLLKKKRENEAYGKWSIVMTGTYNLSNYLSSYRISHSPYVCVCVCVNSQHALTGSALRRAQERWKAVFHLQ